MRNLLLVLLALVTLSQADAGVPDLERHLKELYPATRVSEVHASRVQGLYEVVMGRNVAYSDESGRYMVFGHLYDMKEQKDLTAAMLDALNTVDVPTLPLADAITTVRGKGERRLYVFSDPDCPYCKRLELELAKLDNVAIHTFLYPLDGLHPEATKKAEAIWCAKDSARVWSEFMAGGKVPATGNCETPIQRNLHLGERLGINGTPTLIFENGAMVPGLLPAAEIEKRLVLRKTAAETARTPGAGN